MAMNVGKTKFIIFHTKGKIINNNIQLKYDDNEPDKNNTDLIKYIERIHTRHQNPSLRSYKLLGIYLDENLTFDFHTQATITKLNRSLFCINKVKNILPKPALKSLYYALIHSHLSYCPVITSCASNKNIKKISVIQKKPLELSPANSIMHILIRYSKSTKFYHTPAISNTRNYYLCTLLYINTALNRLQTPGKTTMVRNNHTT
jgi:hypothetical protein